MSIPVTIVVDTNAAETPLHRSLLARFGKGQVSRRRLDVGDVELTAESGTRRVVLERKTWTDLAKSLTDGRYAEQKMRLLASAAGAEDHTDEDDTAPPPLTPRVHTTIGYVVEGSIRGWWGTVGGAMGGTSSMTNARLEAAIAKTSLRDGIHVLRTKVEDVLVLRSGSHQDQVSPSQT